jgi:hypothetical protein
MKERPTPGKIWIWWWSPINDLRPASQISIELAMHSYTASNLFETMLQKYWYFTESPVISVRFFQNLSPPPVLEISAPFSINGIPIIIAYLFDLLMTHTRPQLPTLGNHWVTVSQSQLSLQSVFDPSKISGVSTNFWLLVHILPGPNRQCGLKHSTILSCTRGQNS